MNDNTLHIAEIPYENGKIRFRYSRVMSDDGTRWIRHGLFQAFYENGELSSEGEYENNLETGFWKSYHENGQLASQGHYENGKEIGVWQYWDSTGSSEESEDFSK